MYTYVCTSKVHCWFQLAVKIIKRFLCCIQSSGYFLFSFIISELLRTFHFSFMLLQFIFTMMYGSTLCTILCGFSYQGSTLVWKQRILLLTHHWKVSGSLWLNTSVICFATSDCVGASSYHIMRRRESTDQEDLLRERDKETAFLQLVLQYIVMMVLFYYQLLSVSSYHSFLNQIFLQVHMQRKKHSIQDSLPSAVSGILCGSWNIFFADLGFFYCNISLCKWTRSDKLSLCRM